MAKQDYYKGMRGIMKDDRIIEAYIDGVRMYRDGNGELHKDQLKPGMTKYNRTILEQVNQLKKEYGILMGAELSLAVLVEKYINGWGLTRNIHHIAYAHRGTISALDRLHYALKHYQVRDQDIYNALKWDIKTTTERRARNADFLDTFMEDCGLGPLVTLVREKFNESMFEYTLRIMDDYWYEKPRQKDEETADYYNRFRDHYVPLVENFASENGLDLGAVMAEKEVAYKAHKQEMTAKIRADCNEKKHAILMQKAKELVEINAANIMRMIRSANQDTNYGDTTYNVFMRNLNAVGGHAWYIAVLKRSILKYRTDTEELNLSESIINMKLYPNRSEAEAEVQKIQEKLPQAAIIIDSITISDRMKERSKDGNRSYTEIQKEQQTRMIRNVLEGGSEITQPTYIYLENMLFLNDMKLIYIGTANNKGGRYLGFNIKGNLALVESIRNCTFYRSIEEAESALAKHRDFIIGQDYEPFINIMHYEKGLPEHKKIQKELYNALNGFMDYLSNVSVFEGYRYDRDLPYFEYGTQKHRFMKIVSENSIYICAEYANNEINLAWPQASGYNCQCELSSMSKGELETMARKTATHKAPRTVLYANITEEGLDAISSYFDMACGKIRVNAPHRPTMIIQISKDKDAYKWTPVKNNMCWE